MQTLFKLIFLFFSVIFFSQSTNKNIDSLRKNGNIEKSILEYQNLIKLKGLSKNIANDYAEVLSLHNDVDSSFHYLEISVVGDSTSNTLRNPLFCNLTSDKRWELFTNKQLDKYQAKQGKFKDYDYAKNLFALQQKDQLYYYEIHVSEKLTGRKSLVTNALWKLKEKTNKELLNELDRLIKKNGYPKCSEKMPCAAAFLIIQHADLETQERYIDEIKTMCQNNNIPCSHYAMMQDRINLRKGKPQIFGTQYEYNKKGDLVLYKLFEPDKLNDRRLDIGLKALKIK